jgi:hypothetical protein
VQFRLLLIFAVSIACTTTKTSEWTELESVEELDCTEWKLRPGDLRTDSVFLQEKAPAYGIVNTTMRNGAPGHFAFQFKGGLDVDQDALKPIPLGRSDQLLGAVFFKGDTFALVGAMERNKFSLQLRNVTSNVVVHSLNGLATTEVASTATVPAENGFWLIYETSSGQFRVAFIPAGEKVNIEARVIKKVWEERPRVVGSKGNVFAVMQSGNGLRFTAINPNGTSEDRGGIDIGNAKAPLESWDADVVGKTLKVAAVTGDSLVGDAKLHLFDMDDGGTDTLQKRGNATQALQDFHVSEPMLLVKSGEARVLMLQWLDAEATLATYAQTGDGLKKVAQQGIFDSGSRIMQAINYRSDKLVLIRAKLETTWKYELCEFKE